MNFLPLPWERAGVRVPFLSLEPAVSLVADDRQQLEFT